MTLFIICIGRAWLIAFDPSEELPEDASEEGLTEIEQERVKKRKRIGRVSELIRQRSHTVVTGLCTLAAAQPMDRYVALHLRDVGPMTALDWRARARAGGGDWRRKGMWTKHFEDLEEEAQAEEEAKFQPTLFSFYEGRKETVLRVAEQLSSLLRPADGGVDDDDMDVDPPDDMDVLEAILKTVPERDEREVHRDTRFRFIRCKLQFRTRRFAYIRPLS